MAHYRGDYSRLYCLQLDLTLLMIDHLNRIINIILKIAMKAISLI